MFWRPLLQEHWKKHLLWGPLLQGAQHTHVQCPLFVQRLLAHLNVGICRRSWMVPFVKHKFFFRPLASLARSKAGIVDSWLLLVSSSSKRDTIDECIGCFLAGFELDFLSILSPVLLLFSSSPLSFCSTLWYDVPLPPLIHLNRNSLKLGLYRSERSMRS